MANLKTRKLFRAELFMASTTHGFKRLFPFFVLVGLILIHFGSSPDCLYAQSQAQSQGIPPYTTVVHGPIPAPSPLLMPQVSGSGPGLTIIPTFDASIDSPTQTVINNAIAFYHDTFATNIMVNIQFHTMSSGLGQSDFIAYFIPYTTYRAALAANATSPDDGTALANTPSGSTNPVTGSGNIIVKSANGRAIGLNTPEALLNGMGSPCPTFTGSGCIGLNVTLANSLGVLMATVEHEIDEVLGLGSALSGTTTPADPWTEDLFRWGSPGVRSFATNTSTTNPCTSTPASFFSIDGGTTDLDTFNNCNNGGDYGDWITHTPSQVQDAFTNGSGSPSLRMAFPEVRALDVIGYNIAFNHFAEVAVWRPSNGTWYVIPNSNPSNFLVQQWGVSSDMPVRGDFDGDGITDFAVWRPSNGTWYVIPSGNPSSFLVQQWGLSGDIPVPGDYDGDGKTDFAVFRPSNGTWYIIPSSNPSTVIVQQWGLSGDVPVPGDYDGDGKTDFAVWRPSNGTWYVIPSSNPGNFLVQQWGLSGDKPAPGDYDGDGKTDFAVWRPSNGTWYVIPSSNPSNFLVQQWGVSTDSPVPGDYDGDGKADFAVWRPSNGTWYVIPSSTPTNYTVTQWGISTDVPVQKPIGQ
jgi:hypothetical protein